MFENMFSFKRLQIPLRKINFNLFAIFKILIKNLTTSKDLGHLQEMFNRKFKIQKNNLL